MLTGTILLFSIALGEDPAFLRFIDQGNWEGCLQTAAACYEDSRGREVTLVAAFHVGDLSYYRELQTLLEGFDPVLFEGGEGSAGDWTLEPEGIFEGNLLEGLMKMSGRMFESLENLLTLDLGGRASQWDSIDYSRKNFLAADMDLKTFRRLSRERGEAFTWIRIALAFFPEYLGERLDRLTENPPWEFLRFTGALRNDRRKVLRFLYARELAAADVPFQRLLARRFDGKTVIIHDRDRIVLEALRRQLESGKARIGIFYGADHMPDLERRLADELGFRKKGERWFTVWKTSGEGDVAREVAAGRTELRSGDLRAVVATNAAYGPRHREGYSGISELSHRGSERPFFVPEYAGLNFEHIFSGDAASYGWNIFEPRRSPMALFRISGNRAELRQERTEHWPLRTRISYEVSGDDAIDFAIACVPLEDAWGKHGTIGLFFASYIDSPEDPAIHFIGRSRPGKGDPAPRWIRHLPPEHGKAACHRPAGSDWDPVLDPGFNIPLAGGLSDLEFLYPFYYGVSRGKVLILMFERNPRGGEVRFAQSPSGAGAGNPAWDFLFLKRGYRITEEFLFRGRAVHRDSRGTEDVIRAYEEWSGEAVKRPAQN